MKLPDLIDRARKHPWLAEGISLLAGAAYAWQAQRFAHGAGVTMDEGTYLMKGLLFVQGVYTPFEPYGPLTNKTPLSYYIPGLAQALFGAGLRTGRYFAIFLGLLMLVGLWLAARRLGGRWAAAGAVVLTAANAANIVYYSVAISQGLVACMVAWSLALCLGRGRRFWELALAAVLAGLVPLARQNMLPFTGLLWLFLVWEYGRKRGLGAAALGALVFAGLNALWWPAIRDVIWRPLLPGSLGNLFGPSTVSLGESVGMASQNYNLLSKVFVFWEGLRINFAALFGPLAAWIFWPARRGWRSPSDFRAAVLLSAALVVLTAEHYYASAGLDYCLFCYGGYLSFFSPIGLLLVIAWYPSRAGQPGWLRGALASLLVIVGSTGLGFAAYQVIHKPLMALPVPRIKDLHILPGKAELWRTLSNKFGWSYDFLQQFIPTLAGLGLGILLVLAAVLLARAVRRKGSVLRAGQLALAAFLGLGVVLTPTAILSGRTVSDDCGDIIAAHEAAGAALAAEVPPGARVYWENDLSPLPLLYLPGRSIFPPQLNHWYNQRQGGDPDQLYRSGYWNEELAGQWVQEADFLLIADRYADEWVEKIGSENPGEFDELAPTPWVAPCVDRSMIHIFRRTQ